MAVSLLIGSAFSIQNLRTPSSQRTRAEFTRKVFQILFASVMRFGIALPLPTIRGNGGGTKLSRMSHLILLLACGFSGYALAAPFDAAPFGLPLPEGSGVLLEDPREIHKVVVQFSTVPSNPQNIRLEYWGSRWPQQRLPKDREPGGADVGWMELGNWYNGGWRVADTMVKAEGANLVFTFQPVNAKEFPNLKDYAADFRYTL